MAVVPVRVVPRQYPVSGLYRDGIAYTSNKSLLVPIAGKRRSDTLRHK